MKETPIFILSKDRVSFLSQLIKVLQRQGYTNLHIVDTGSTYPPMLKYLSTCKILAHQCKPKGVPKFALWEEKLLDRLGLSQSWYVYTDCDVIPDCPDDWVQFLRGALEKHPSMPKAGLGLKINDLPNHYDRKKAVVKWESQFWRKPVAGGMYVANVDTTAALYRPGVRYTLKALRSSSPYLARHLPWYADSKHPTAEAIYYKNHLNSKAAAYWTRGTHELTKNQ